MCPVRQALQMDKGNGSRVVVEESGHAGHCGPVKGLWLLQGGRKKNVESLKHTEWVCKGEAEAGGQENQAEEWRWGCCVVELLRRWKRQRLKGELGDCVV